MLNICYVCSGALREIQKKLGYECHQFVCLLHLNELFLRHRQVVVLIIKSIIIFQLYRRNWMGQQLVLMPGQDQSARR